MYFLYLFKTNKYRDFLRSSDVFFYTSNSFMTTITFLFETQFRDAIQSADSNNFSIERKSKVGGKLQENKNS